MRAHSAGAGVDNGSRAELDEEVRALEVFGEVDLDGVQVGDVERLQPDRVLGDREFEAALEVVLVVDARQLADERLLVGGSRCS